MLKNFFHKKHNTVYSPKPHFLTSLCPCAYASANLLFLFQFCFQNIPESFFLEKALKQQQSERDNMSAPIDIVKTSNGESSPIITPTRKEGFLDKCKLIQIKLKINLSH